jgi:hypothetical protein
MTTVDSSVSRCFICGISFLAGAVCLVAARGCAVRLWMKVLVAAKKKEEQG